MPFFSRIVSGLNKEKIHPRVALMKVTFERVKSLRPWATLLSDENSDGTEQKSRIRKAITRLKKK